MRNGDVHNKSGCLNKVYTYEDKGENTLAVFKKNTVEMTLKVQVEEVFDDTATLKLKVDGATGQYGGTIDLTALGTTTVACKGMLKDRREIIAEITGSPTTGGVRILHSFYHPSRVKKGI